MDQLGYLDYTNVEFIEQQYQNFLKDPSSVEQDWKYFFEGLHFAKKLSGDGQLSENELQVFKLIQHYQDYGHLAAKLDPLNLQKNDLSSFELSHFGLSEENLSESFSAGAVIGLPNATLKEILEKLKSSYCGTITVQASGCDTMARKWLHNEMENSSFKLSSNEKKEIFHSLVKTESLEKFIHTRYVGTKRFSVEGADALLPMLEYSAQKGTGLGVEEYVIGMAHRGRINVLANFMDKALNTIFADFDGTIKDNTGLDGDVKYHMGYSNTKQTPHGECQITLAFNPSHLEFVNPVACGIARARQRSRNNTDKRDKVIPIQIHGDAAFIGQGVVSETLQLSQLDGYTVGGSLHIILNNQVGFTTNPSDSRSTRYSSDLAHSISAPVLLVNGDDVEACIKAFDIALRFRQQFKQDVVIDLICYRRFGHNEGDEPAFTQPEMYSVIKKHPTLRKIYQEQLVQNSVLTAAEADKNYETRMDNLQDILDDARKNPPEYVPQSFDGSIKELNKDEKDILFAPVDTKVSEADLNKVGEILTSVPEDFNVNSKVKRLIGNRAKMMENKTVDWGMAELLAYGSLRHEGVPVRISGQDAQRGTFTHRHAVYTDQKNQNTYCPLKQINPDKGEFCIYNSSLSETAVLGFEYGNSITDPKFLTIWEAQFGDFANGAQVIIDQFLCSGEQKWAQRTGLTLLLPHGYAGQGPEHSSARLERFLQLCAQNNMLVGNFTTPANLFHAMRRQVLRELKKPLVIMSPKSLLRHPKVVSSLDELSQGQFQEVLPDPKIKSYEDIETWILCSGKLYYELESAITNPKVGLLRVEQLYPFPEEQIAPFLNGAPHLKRVVWAQEEPKNMGAYSFIEPHLRSLLSNLGLGRVPLDYAGRIAKASPATGSPAQHTKEQNQIIDQCKEY